MRDFLAHPVKVSGELLICAAAHPVVDGHEKLLGSGRFSTDQAGYTAMRPATAPAVHWPSGSSGPASTWWTVPAKLAARGCGRRVLADEWRGEQGRRVALWVTDGWRW